MPTTHATFLIGCLALAGVPPLAGFWSKDAVIASVEEKAHELRHSNHAGLGHTPADHEADAAQPARATGDTLLSPEQAEQFGRIYQLLYYVALFVSLMTAIYTFRAFYMTFYGETRVPHEAGHHAHESPLSMTLPLIVLAICSFIVGAALDRTYLARPFHAFADFIGGAPSLAVGAVAATRHPFQFHLFVAGLSTFIALGGWLIATYLYLGDRREVLWLRSVSDLERPSRWLDVESISRLKNISWVAGLHRSASRVGLGSVTAAIGYVIRLIVLIVATPVLLARMISPYKLSSAKFYFDEIYQLLIVWPLRALAEVCYVIDRWIIDGLVNLVGRMPATAGTLMRSLQVGLVPFYALSMLLGALVLFAARLLWAG